MEDPQYTEILKLMARLKELEAGNSEMYGEIQSLKTRLEVVVKGTAPVEKQVIEAIRPEVSPAQPNVFRERQPAPQEVKPSVSGKVKNQKTKQDWERFVGENLINKIGILITVIGVGIGAKYAFEHQLISPVMRIVLGYALGGGLMFFALKLKAKYLDFSAVLLSGSMAIFYFLTYISFSFYHFFPIQLTFLLMIVFTVFTVLAAIRYDRQIIAHLGLVGAYGIPFLLSDGSGKILFFYSYIAIINIGILVVAYFKNWRPVLYVTFGFTWGIFLLWYAFAYKAHEHFHTAMFFLSLYFLIFYGTGLVYKVTRHQKFEVADIFLIMGNSFLFFGIGYSLLAGNGKAESSLAWFSIINALVHFIVSMILYRDKEVDRTVFYFTCSMVLLFVTITIPLLFDGNAVTLAWSFEALLLFVAARLKKISLFEHMSYPVVVLAFLNLLYFWLRVYGNMSFFKENDLLEAPITAANSFLFNYKFLTSFCFLGAAAGIYFADRSKKFGNPLTSDSDFLRIFRVTLVLILLLVSFTGVFLEISQYWTIKAGIVHQMKGFRTPDPENIVHAFELCSKIGYALLFTGLVLFTRRKKTNTLEFNVFSFIISTSVLMIFLTLGLYQLSFLQLKYLYSSETYYSPFILVFLRFVLYGLLAFYVYSYREFNKKQFTDPFFAVFSEYLFHTVLVWVLSAELVNWMHLFDSRQVYKLSLSIFWGMYALGLVAFGIWKKKSFLRVGAISLFGVTLIKVFFYDLAHMTTLTKTVVFIVLGVILLLISFLYNKYKGILFDESEEA